ncbi:MAG: methyltransferase domain-containing protein [Tumebacillaceae bacterium]
MNVFEKKRESYYEEMKLPWTRLFYEEAKLQLAMHLPERPGQALVVGCGFGLIDRWLAKRGWQVTGVDVTPGYLELARQAAADEGLAIEYQRMDAAADDWSALGGPYDLVVCHNVLDFLQELEATIARIADHTNSSGLVSIIHHNSKAKPIKTLMMQNDPELALEQLSQTQFYVQTFETYSNMIQPETVSACLQEAGCEVAGHYGIRTLYDYVSNEQKFEPAWHAQMLELEKAVWDKHPYRDIAAFFHFIACKH